MGRGLSPLQHEIMEHVAQHGSIKACIATGIAACPISTSWSHRAPQRTAEASAYRSLKRLVRRGLLQEGKSFGDKYNRRVKIYRTVSA